MSESVNKCSPRLTVVMPVFNRPKELVVMVDSILANTFRDFELIAIDDGSEAQTLALLKQYVEHDSRVILLHRAKSPKGAQTCRNIGLENARGEYIIFVDSDDYVTPECFATRLRHISERPELDFMVFPSGGYNSNDGFNPVGHQFGYTVFGDDLCAFLRRTLPFVVWNNIYRTEALREHSIKWDTQLLSLQDSLFNTECLLADMHYDYAHVSPNYGWRVEDNAGSISKRIVTEPHFRSHLYTIEKVYKLVQSKYGHRYDRDLFRGVLYLYNMIFAEGIDDARARLLVDVVRSYSRLGGFILRSQVSFTHVLELILTKRKARVLPMVAYLIWLRRENKRIQERRAQLASGLMESQT